MRLLRYARNDGKMHFFVIARSVSDEAISIKFTKYQKFAKLEFQLKLMFDNFWNNGDRKFNRWDYSYAKYD